jgi:hypothetical protein
MRISLFILVTSFPSILFAQTLFESQTVEHVYNLLQKSCEKKTLTDTTIFPCIIDNKNISVKILKNNENKIFQVGMCIFKNTATSPYPNCIYTFLERKLIEYLLLPNNKAVLKKSEEDNINLKFNGSKLGEFSFSEFSKVLDVINDSLRFNLGMDSTFYTARFYNSTGDVLGIHFPVRNTLITGMDKKELDDKLVHQLALHKLSNETFIAIDKNDLAMLTDSIYIQHGKTYFPGISSDKYIIKNNETYSYLFMRNFLSESFSNCFLEELPDMITKKINISHHYSMNLNNFLDYFTSDYEFYFGLEDCSPESLSGTLILRNPYLGFIDLLYIKTTSEQLFNPTSTISCTFYSNIPSDNIKNLFNVPIDENKQYKYLLRKN